MVIVQRAPAPAGQRKKSRGQAMVGMLIFVSATALLAVNLLTMGLQLRSLSARTLSNAQAVYAAEAGVIYMATQLQTGGLIADFTLDVLNKDANINVAVNTGPSANFNNVLQGGVTNATQLTATVTNWL
ncbi:MAG: hypothetical protein NC924_01420 [Candidatus Omnitrophica bacterium]|nr:hypothetical protein [Candidatus Omnitrophota bacterium]